MTPHLSTLKLHQLRYGELSEQAEAQARAHIAECPLCAERLGNQQSERAAFEAQPVPPAILEATHAAPKPANNTRAWWGVASLLTAVAVVLLAVGVPAWNSRLPGDPTGIEGIRPKGHTPFVHASAFRDTPTGPERLSDGDRVQPGDRLQFAIRSAPQPWVTLAGVDATGAATVFGSWQPTGGGPEPAPFGLTLDATLGTETLYVLYSATEPNRAALRAELTSGALSDDRVWEVMTLDKVP